MREHKLAQKREVLFVKELSELQARNKKVNEEINEEYKTIANNIIVYYDKAIRDYYKYLTGKEIKGKKRTVDYMGAWAWGDVELRVTANCHYNFDGIYIANIFDGVFGRRSKIGITHEEIMEKAKKKKAEIEKLKLEAKSKEISEDEKALKRLAENKQFRKKVLDRLKEIK